MASTLWSPQSSLGSSSYFLSPLSPYDQHHFNGSNHYHQGLPAPLLASSPVNSRHRRTQSVMDNSLDLVAEADSANLDGDCDSGYFHNQLFSQNYPHGRSGYNSQQMNRNVNNAMIPSQFMFSPVEGDMSGNYSNSSCSSSNGEIITSASQATTGPFSSLTQFLRCRTELLVSGQQATPWNHFTIVGQLRKLENLNLIDRSLIKQDNPPIEILTLVQKLVKYNLAVEIIDSEDEQLRQEQLTKLIKLRCEEVLAISGSITEITERRQAIYTERCRIRLVMKEIGAQIAAKASGKDPTANSATPINESENIVSQKVVARPMPPPLLQNTGINTTNNPLICL